MSKKEMHTLVQVICYGLMVTAIGLCTPALTAEDSKDAKSSTEKPCKTCQVRVEVQGKIPFLEQLPIVKHLFQKPADKPVEQTAENQWERIGVDFDLLPGHMISFVPFGDCEAICTESGCTFCPASGACEAKVACRQACKAAVACNHECCKAAVACGKAAVACNHECCQAAGCKSCSETKEVAAKLELPVAHESHQACSEHHVAEHFATCEKLTELQVQNASLQSAIDAHEALAEAKDEMFEMLLELSAANSKLQARVEFLKEQSDLQERLMEAMAENAKLKATVELAEERQEMLKQSLEVAVENERLKLRVAELEQGNHSSAKATASGKKTTKTAKKSPAKKGTVVK